MTYKLRTRHALLAAAALVALPGAALAQNDVEAQANQVAAEAQDLAQASNELANTVDTQQAADEGAAAGEGREGEGDREDRRDRDDKDFPWGLLGLLGLAGLLGLKRRDDHHHHVDRHDRMGGPGTGTTTGTARGGTDTRL